MKALALALALAATPALAIEWEPVDTSPNGTRVYVDRDVSHTRTAAVTLARIDTPSGSAHKFLVYVSAEECTRGFGALRESDLSGGKVRLFTEFTLHPPVTVADKVATHLCSVFDY